MDTDLFSLAMQGIGMYLYGSANHLSVGCLCSTLYECPLVLSLIQQRRISGTGSIEKVAEVWYVLALLTNWPMSLS
jgi:hypothetical protein